MIVHDYSTRDGATRLALDIAAFWTERGYSPPELVVEQAASNRKAVYVHTIRSDMVNGLPRAAP